MKIILLKKCKEGNVNDIIEVADGYAKNFMIKKGLALPLNNKTKKVNDQKIQKEKDNQKHLLENALAARQAIEKLKLIFKLKTTNLVVHGSVTRKQIHQALKAKKITLDSHLIENIKIVSLGISKVKVKLHPQVMASLKVEVLKDDR